MKSKRRSLGLMSKVKHIVSNKKYEWEQDRQESKVMKAKADEVGKRKAQAARKRHMEREAEDKYRRKYGLQQSGNIGGQRSIPSDPFGMSSMPQPKAAKTSKKKESSYDPFGWQDF